MIIISNFPSSIDDLAMFDRANGVCGNYCIGFLDDLGTAHFWGKMNTNDYGFCSAGIIYTDTISALSVLEILKSYILLNSFSKDKIAHIHKELEQETVKLNSCISDYSKLLGTLETIKLLINEVDVVT